MNAAIGRQCQRVCACVVAPRRPAFVWGRGVFVRVRVVAWRLYWCCVELFVDRVAVVVARGFSRRWIALVSLLILCYDKHNVGR